MKKIVVIGAGGFGREVLDVIDAINVKEKSYDPLGFIVDKQYGNPGTIINDLPILGDTEWLENRKEEIYAVCSIGASHLRYQIIQRLSSFGCKFATLIHPSAVLTRWVKIGEGTVITAGCILTNQIKIGNHVHINLDCTIGHDAILDNFSTLAPGVHVSGNVTIKEGAYIGTGANIIEKINIGEWSVTGAGSAIVKDVPPNTTVVGIPGKVIKERDAGWHLA